jgi:hypothetical protein
MVFLGPSPLETFPVVVVTVGSATRAIVAGGTPTSGFDRYPNI